MTFDQIAWLPVCAGLTGAGLVLSFLLLRRRGAAAGLRAAAWALLPLAAYLTGALPTLWQIGTAVTGFVTGLVLNPTVWAGVAVAGVSVLLFLVSGFMRGRRLAAARGAAPAATAAPGAPAVQSAAAGQGAAAVTQPLPKRTPATARPAQKPAAKPAAQPAADDDFSDIEDILKRRGIG
ncbi:cellulose synthase [Planomonospora sphaerica]|uniref:Cellulose synthase n=1 Tax=Planomonospora sphaerica TaxID=161355 RepID=A0A161LMQ8_9ACTN|nr:cellulose synthase [Planomonospora sphaerica]GAT68655.1 cellulose synthase [Planomonospora sphaerica]